MSNLFVYGTLMSKYRNPLSKTVETHARHVCLEGLDFTRGRIDDFVILWHPDFEFPFIVPCKGKKVFGELYYDVTSSTLDEIDIIENVSWGYFERIIVNVHTKDASTRAFVYKGHQILQEIFSNTLSCEDLTVLEINT
jgi:gamma-glutamylcyclotransferase (GGCT)/AIG2-like uncharacterized protein YtfP